MTVNRKSVSQLIFFLAVGIITLGIDIGVSWIALHKIGLSAYFASGLGFLSGFFFNFPMNRKKVFRHTKNDKFNLSQQIVLFASLSIFNLIATSAIIGWLVSVEVFEIQYAKTIVTGIVAIWNFFILKNFIFSKTHHDK